MDLKPCPFCGSKDISTSWGLGKRITNMPECYWIIGCGCGATMLVRMKVNDFDQDSLPTRQEAREIARDGWNRRVEV